MGVGFVKEQKFRELANLTCSIEPEHQLEEDLLTGGKIERSDLNTCLTIFESEYVIVQELGFDGGNDFVRKTRNKQGLINNIPRGWSQRLAVFVTARCAPFKGFR
jgi:hypothetical protein